MSEETANLSHNKIYVDNNRLYSKFGEIFFTTDCRCLFVCAACDHDFEFFDVFIEHLGVDHDFQNTFESSDTKRLVCISNVVEDNNCNGEESFLIEEETKDLIEFELDEIIEEEAPSVEADVAEDNSSNADRSLETPTLSIDVESFLSDCDEIKETILHISPDISNENAKRRTNTSHMSVLKEHKCDMCGKKYASEKNLVRHKWRHSSQTKWSCPTCGKVTTTKDGMILHVRRKHTGEKPFQCKFCEKSFASSAQRNLHHRVHTGYKPYVCEKCGKTFKLYTVLRYHMDWHMGIKNYKCEKCDKKFHSTSELNNHKSVHTCERPFPCPDCNLRFKTQRHLRRHKEVHSGNLKMCKYCNKGFAHISTLTSHLRVHQLDEID